MSVPVRLAVILLVDGAGRLLLQERDEGAPRAANQWGMVGGHVEDGEEFEAAAYRELAEETGVEMPAGGLTLCIAEDFTYPDGYAGRYRIYAAHTTLRDEDIVVGEGRQIVFVEPERLRDLDLADSTAHFAPKFLATDFYAAFCAEHPSH